MAEGDSSGKQDFKRRLAQKALMPIVATAASAAAGYAAKNGPALLEEKVLPKLKEAAHGAGGMTEDVRSRTASAAGGLGDVAEHLTQRAKDAVPGSARPGRSGGLSRAELDRHVEQRAAARAARRKQTTTR